MPTRWPNLFVDSFKTELIKDRVWQSRSQLELAILEYFDWFNNRRLHESLGDIPPVEFETEWAAANTAIPGELSVKVTTPEPSERLRTADCSRGETETGVPARDQVETDDERAAQNGAREEPGPARTAPSLVVDETPQLVSLTP
jgi:Integrase core domain